MENNISDIELQDMREQIAALKAKLSNEAIVNEKLLRNATKSRMMEIQKKGLLSILIGIFAIPYTAWAFSNIGLSWYFVGATIAMLIFCTACTAVMHHRVNSNTASTGSLFECAKQIKKLKKEYLDWFKIAIPMICCWIAWLCTEVIIKTPDMAYALALVGGMIFGGCIGGFIGYSMHRKVINTCDDILASLGETDE